MATETTIKNRRYNELSIRLNSSLPSLVEQCSRLSKCDDVIVHPAELLARLEKVSSEADDIKIDVDDLKSSGDELVSVLEELDCLDTPKAREIKLTVETHCRGLVNLLDTITGKRRQFQDDLLRYLAAEKEIKFWTEWIKEVEERFDKSKCVSLDIKKLTDRVATQQKITVEMTNSRNSVEQAVEQGRLVGIVDSSSNLNERYADLSSQVVEVEQHLVNIQEKLSTVYENSNQVIRLVKESLPMMVVMDIEHSTWKHQELDEFLLNRRMKHDMLGEVCTVGGRLLADYNSEDREVLRDVMENVICQWQTLSQALLTFTCNMTHMDITTVSKYCSEVEDRFQSVESVIPDPNVICCKLEAEKECRKTLLSHQQIIDDDMSRCDQLLSEDPNLTPVEDSKNSLVLIQARLQKILLSSNTRLTLLTEILPLVTRMTQSKCELDDGLSDVHAELESLMKSEDGAEDAKAAQFNIKNMQQLMVDYQSVVQDIKSIGHEITSACSNWDCSSVMQLVEDISNRFITVKQTIKQRLSQLDEIFNRISTDVGENLSNILSSLQNLRERINFVEDVSANLFVLNQQDSEVKDILSDLKDIATHIGEASKLVKCLESVGKDGDKYQDVRCRLDEIVVIQSSIEETARQRATLLQDTMIAADQFYLEYLNVSELLHGLQDHLGAISIPGVNSVTVKQQLTEITAISEEVVQVRQQLQNCMQTAAVNLESICPISGSKEIQKCSDDFQDLDEEVVDKINEQTIALQLALERTITFESFLQSVLAWMPGAKSKLESMPPIADSLRAVRIQIEEFKVFKVQISSWYSDMHNLNQFLSELKRISPVDAGPLATQVLQLNSAWQHLVTGYGNRETNLRKSLIELGEVDHAIEDVIGYLQQVETDLQKVNQVYGDSCYIEIHLKKIEALLKDLGNQKEIIKKLDETINSILKRSDGRNSSPLAVKQSEMMSLYDDVQSCAREKRDELICRLKEVKSFVHSIDELLKWLNDHRRQMKRSRPVGALPDTARAHYNKTLMFYQELEIKEMEVMTLFINGEDMFARCQAHEAQQLRHKLEHLRATMKDTKAKADQMKAKMEEHIERVNNFHSHLSTETIWLTECERSLKNLKQPSKIFDQTIVQLAQLKDLQVEIAAHSEFMKSLDKNGTFLKYFGSQQDSIFIRDLLSSVRIRWKKLSHSSDETLRILQRASNENRRFFESWKTLCGWLDETEVKLQKLPIGVKTKQNLDEIKRIDLQMSARQPSYRIIRRQGTSILEKSRKNDPEKACLTDMMEEISCKWNNLRSLVLQRQDPLDLDGVLSAPDHHHSDAVGPMSLWLRHAEVYLSDVQPLLGDVATVSLLIDQHSEFQKEFERRMEVIQKFQDGNAETKTNHLIEMTSDRASRLVDTKDDQASRLADMKDDRANRLVEMIGCFSRLRRLIIIRRDDLHEALKLAEEFNEGIEAVQEWLPLAEIELKFKPIPDDEDGIMRFIENHEKFHEDLLGQEPDIEKLNYLGEEILVSCHRNAARVVNHHLFVTKTRWNQVLRRSMARTNRLQEALMNVRRSTTLHEEIGAWLKEAEDRLTVEQGESVCGDLASVEEMAANHMLFHQELLNKNKDIDKVKRPKDFHVKPRKSGVDCRPVDGGAVVNLREKWQKIWQMSTARKKQIQDHLDSMLEKAKLEQFDYYQWRQRAADWFNARKLRVNDLFRLHDRSGRGLLSRSQFIDGMIASKFPSSKTELNAVFDMFSISNSGLINYRDFIRNILSDQCLPGRVLSSVISDSELIREEIRQQMLRCQCIIPFPIQKIDDSKYKFGEKGRQFMVRFVNSSVTVRVGGGWMTIDEFLDSFDPCRFKSRTIGSHTGITTPPECAPRGPRSGQYTPPEGLWTARSDNPNRLSANLTSPREGGSSSMTSSRVITSPNSDSGGIKCERAPQCSRSRGGSGQQKTNASNVPNSSNASNVPNSSNTSRLSLQTVGASPSTNRRKGFQDLRKHNSVQ